MVENASHDENDVPTLIGVSNVDGKTPVKAWIDPVTHRLLTDSGGAGSSVTITDGSTTVTNVTTIDFTSGATVSSGGAGIADVAITGGGGTPAAPNTSIQFNDGGNFGGSQLNYDKTGNPDAIFTTPPGSGTNDGSSFSLTTGNGGATSGSGGDISITAGSATTDGSGGDINNIAGDGAGANDGGDYSIAGGTDGDAAGEAATLFVRGSRFNDSGRAGDIIGNAGAGNNIDIDGGNVVFQGGDGGNVSGVGGSISLTAGSAQGGDSIGGDVNVSSGEGHGIGVGGDVNVTANGITSDVNISAGGDGFTGVVNVLLNDAYYDSSTGGFNIKAKSANPPYNATFYSTRRILTHTGATQTFTLIELDLLKLYSVILEVRATAAIQNLDVSFTGGSFGRRATFVTGCSGEPSPSPSEIDQLGSTQNFYTENPLNVGDITFSTNAEEIRMTITQTSESTQWVCEIFYIISYVDIPA